MMLDMLISGLVLAALGGLGSFAYKHPDGYRKISPYLATVIAAAFLAGVSYNVGVDMGSSAIEIEAIKFSHGRVPEMRAAAERLMIDWRVLFVILPALFGGNLFLVLLPNLTGKRDD